MLEDEFERLLFNARHVKQVPGRKTNTSDSAWLCQPAEAGLLRASFVPPTPIRALRNLTRYRKTQIPGARPRPTACTRRLRTPAPSSTASPPTPSASPLALCAMRWWPGGKTPSCSPIWPAAGCAPRFRRCGRRGTAALSARTRCGSGAILYDAERASSTWWPELVTLGRVSRHGDRRGGTHPAFAPQHQAECRARQYRRLREGGARSCV